MRKILLLAVVLALTAAPAMVQAWSDNFNYPNGPLAGNGGWAGVGVGIDVVNTNKVWIGSGPNGTSFNDAVAIGPVNDPNQIICTLWAFPGTSSGSNIWGADFDDASGANFARWYGAGANARPRINGGAVLNTVNLVAGTWNKLEVVINQTAGTSTFYHNGLNLGSMSYTWTGATGGVGQVQLEAWGRTDVPNDYILVDNMRVVIPEPSSLVALSMFGLGALGFIRRRS